MTTGTRRPPGPGGWGGPIPPAALRRGLAATAGALLALVFAFPHAAGAEETASDVEMMDEVWFYKYRQPLEQLPEEPPRDDAGLVGIAEATVRDGTGQMYQGAFVRVGVNLGEEEARAYLTLPLIELGGGLNAIVTGGTITLVAAPTEPEEPPEDADPEAQDSADAAAPEQRNVEEADLVACLPETGVGGSDRAADWADAPEVSCDVRSPLEPVEGAERPTWTLDLAPFTKVWADPMANNGVAIMADPDRAGDPEQSWHVAFPASFNQLAGPPPLAQLTYEEQDLGFGDDDSGGDDDFGDDEDFGDDPGDVSDDGDDGLDDDFDDGGGFEDEDLGGDGGLDTGGGFDAGGGGDAGDTGLGGGEDFDSAAAPLDGEDDAAAAESEPVAATGAGEGGGGAPLDAQPTDVRTNPAVFALPLLALGLAGLLGYSLTQDPELGQGRRGPVSKLMDRRRAGGRATTATATPPGARR